MDWYERFIDIYWYYFKHDNGKTESIGAKTYYKKI